MASEPQKFKHVRCIDAKAENLNFFVSSSLPTSFVAVIFISSDDSCEIGDYDFADAELDFPALMVPRSVGDMFLKTLKEVKRVAVGIKVSSGELFLVHMYVQ